MSENFQKVKAYLQELELPTETEDEAEALVKVWETFTSGRLSFCIL